MKKQLLTVLSILSFGITNATTYYVSTTGNDNTGNGTIGNPWKTLYKATSTVSGVGDIIHLNAGTYTETQKCILEVGVSIEGDGATNTIIKSTLTADWTEILQLYSAVEGTNGNQHISNIKFDGSNLSTYWGIQIVGRSNVEVHHIEMVDFKASGIFFNGRTDNVEEAPTVFSTGNSFHDNVVHNCAAYDLSTGVYGRGALNIGGQQGMLVYNNILTQTERPDGYNGWLIKYGLGGYNKGLKIYNNTITKLPYTGNYGGENGWDFCLELWHSLGGLEIYNNTCQGAFDLVHTYKFDYPFGSWVHHNTISQTILNSHNETGILYEKGVESALVENNIVNNCSSGLEVFCEYFGAGDTVYNPVIDLTVRNNQFTNIGKAGGNGNNGYAIQIVGGLGLDQATPVSIDMRNVLIYNNTMTAAPGNAPWFGIGLNQNQSLGTINNVQIVNNIVRGFYGAWLVEGHSTSSFDTLIIKNNFIDQNGSANGIYAPFTAPTNYINTGNILGVDPLFVASPTDFHLQSSSPAIDAGINVGIAYNGSAPDVGCYEFTIPNIAPTANAGSNQTITLPTSTVTFNGSGTDTDGTIISYTWAQQSGPNTATLSGSTTATLNVSGLIAGTYVFRLTVADNNGSTGYSDVTIVVNSAPTSLGSIATNNNIIYPNPATNDITIQLTDVGYKNITLTDILGNIVINEMATYPTTTINISSLAKGVYMVKISGDTNQLIKTIIKQ